MVILFFRLLKKNLRNFVLTSKISLMIRHWIFLQTKIGKGGEKFYADAI